MAGVRRNGTRTPRPDGLANRTEDDPPLSAQHPNVFPAIVLVRAAIALKFQPFGDGFPLPFSKDAQATKGSFAKRPRFHWAKLGDMNRLLLYALLFCSCGSRDAVGFDLEFGVIDPDTLIIEWAGAPGSFVVSPLSTDSLYGKVALECPSLEFGAWRESPASRGSWDPYAEGFVRFVQVPTRWKIPLERLPKGDFDAEAELFFVVEPACIPYSTTLTLQRRNGNWAVAGSATKRLN